MMIVSASRRTDIPAFYSDWFLHRIRSGRVVYANPFSGKPCELSLHPDQVHSIVFWTKDFAPLLPRLPELKRRGFGWTALFTITGAPALFEPAVPQWMEACRTFQEMAEENSPRHLTWRFDPVVLSTLTPRDYWVERFCTIADQLHGFTRRCIVSFVQSYARAKKRMSRLEEAEGIKFFNPDPAEKRSLLQELAAVAAARGMTLEVCCDESLAGDGVGRACCIDGEELSRLFPEKPKISGRKATRPGCGCTESRDLGAYGTCAHGCIYCYANASPEEVKRNAVKYYKEGESLLPLT